MAHLLVTVALAVVLLGFAAAPRGRPELGHVPVWTAHCAPGQTFITAARSSPTPARRDAELQLRSDGTQEKAVIASRAPSLVQAVAPERRDARLLGPEHMAFPAAFARASDRAAMFACPAECERAAVSLEHLPESAGDRAANPATGPPARRVASA